jgi:hypothetical protein
MLCFKHNKHRMMNDVLFFVCIAVVTGFAREILCWFFKLDTVGDRLDSILRIVSFEE